MNCAPKRLLFSTLKAFANGRKASGSDLTLLQTFPLQMLLVQKSLKERKITPQKLLLCEWSCPHARPSLKRLSFLLLPPSRKDWGSLMYITAMYQEPKLENDMKKKFYDLNQHLLYKFHSLPPEILAYLEKIH